MKRVDRVPAKFRRQVELRLKSLQGLIKKRREELGLTQEGLSEKLEISLETMKAIEGGKRFPSLPMLFYILLFLGIEVEFKP
jgi:DNA-binding XRE family transcriptional regulator